MKEEHTLSPRQLNITGAVQQAVDFHQKGDLKEAEDLYRRVISVAPNHTTALHLLGVISHQTGHNQEAVDLIRRALLINPEYAEAYANLGNALQDLEQFAEAIIAYQKALHLKPTLTEVYASLGNALSQMGEHQQAAESYQTALIYNPNSIEYLSSLAETLSILGELRSASEIYKQLIQQQPTQSLFYFKLANLLTKQGFLEEAVNAYRDTLRLTPGHKRAYNNLGNILHRKKEYSEAIEMYQLATEIDPDYAEAYNNLGNVYRSEDQLEQAANSYQDAIRIRPDYAEAYSNLGLTLIGQKRIDDAITACQRAISLSPSFPAAHNNLGLTFIETGDLDQAIAAYRRAIDLNPNYLAAYGNLSTALMAQGKVVEAIHKLRYALGIGPNHVELRTNYGMACLTVGDFENGWKDYEWRLQTESLHRDFSSIPWTGQEILGATLLLYAEQGIGDTIQFIRFIPTVASLVKNIVIECHPVLKSLLDSAPICENVTDIVVKGGNLPYFDIHASLMSLPYLLGIDSPDLIPNRLPYLETLQTTTSLIGSCPKKKKIGIAWAGNPEHENDKYRSIPVQTFASIFSSSDCSFFSLQVGEQSKIFSSIQWGIDIVDCAPLINVFLDTASLVNQLDLVISVDSSVAHLAGAMGKPVWILLPANADWRWMMDRKDSPWYPTMRLFRQTRLGDWSDVFDAVKEALMELGMKSD